jgi:hypothetical protein
LENDQKVKYEDIINELDLIDIEKIKIDKELVQSKKRTSRLNQPNIRSTIIGSLILIAGVILTINPTMFNVQSMINRLITNQSALNIKVGLALILIGLFLIVLIYEKTPKQIEYQEGEQKPTKKKFLISEKIAMVLSIWVLFLVLITYTISVDIFFILVFIGALITKELTDEYTAPNLKIRVNAFIFVFLIFFLVIIAQNILRILNM